MIRLPDVSLLKNQFFIGKDDPTTEQKAILKLQLYLMSSAVGLLRQLPIRLNQENMLKKGKTRITICSWDMENHHVGVNYNMYK